MRIDFPQVPVQGGMNVKTGTGAFTDSLKDGDQVKAEVLSNDKGAVVMKTDEGQIFRARLDTDAVLSQGDKVLLEFAGKEGKLVFLSLIGEETAGGETTGQSALVRDFDDKSLAPFAGKLAELHMNVTEEAARTMRELILQNPGMTLEEAAFLASNKLTGDESLVKAALAVLSNGEKTDELLARLIDLLGSRESTTPAESTPNSTLQTPQSMEQNPLPALNAQLSTGESPLTDWLKTAGESAAAAAESPEKGVPPDAQFASQTIITQSDTILQSRNIQNNVENQQNLVFSAEQPALEAQKPVITQPETPQIPIPASPEPAINSNEPQPPTEQTQNSTLQTPQSTQLPQLSNPQTPNSNLESHGKVIAQLLSDIPEFRGTPASALERFSNMLLRTVNYSSDMPGGDTKKLADLLDKLFARIEKNDADAGERLRNTREELFARLALVEEAISRAAPQARTEMLEQTRRVMDHVRLLNSIDQFVYVQLPVRMGEERKTAELYLFRKKNGKRVDPENVNILLALDLENMGHWEGLINIRNKDVSIRMEVRGGAEKEYFSEKTVMLHGLLAEAGFKLVGTGITYSEEETTPLTALSVLDRYTSGRPEGIDFVI